MESKPSGSGDGEEADCGVTDRAPEYSYFVGASTGGQQGLAEAQRFPEDYDGIITQVPGSNRTFLHTYFLWTVRNFTDAEGKPRFTDADVEKIYQIACGCIEECGLGSKEVGFSHHRHMMQGWSAK